tara:strand:+ start:1144 stop:1299 length:156 start_codon:yes stop_codon:yes gene_type:complete
MDKKINKKNNNKNKNTNIKDILINPLGHNYNKQKNNYPTDIQGLFERLGIE